MGRPARYPAPMGHDDQRTPGEGDPENALRDLFRREPEPSDPRAKEAALDRLRRSPDETLALFEDNLREDALRAGATEQEIREAQADHPQH
jgi:hypothetical protein